MYIMGEINEKLEKEEIEELENELLLLSSTFLFLI